MSESAKPLRRRPWFKVAVAVVLAAVMTALSAVGLATDQLQFLRDWASDRQLPADAPAERAVVVVGIDRESLSALEADGVSWPWPRSVHAELVDRLTEAGVASVGYDVVFDFERPDDAQFAEALARAGNVVLAQAVDGSLEPPARADRLRFYGAPDLTQPVPALTEAAASLGHAGTLSRSNTEIVRWTPLVLDHLGAQNGRALAYPSLALAAVLVAIGDTAALDQVAKGAVSGGEDFVQLGGFPVTTDGRSGLLVPNYARGLETPAAAERAGLYVSAVDLLEGRVDPAQLAGGVVFVGMTDPLMGDMKLTPVARTGDGTPGVFVHANAAETIISGNYRIPAQTTQTLLAVALLTLVAALAVLFLPTTAWLVVLAVALVGFERFTQSQSDGGQVWDLVYPSLAALLGAISGVVYRYFTESRERRMVSSLFSQYVPEQVAQQLIDAGRVQAATEGERIEVSAFFCDLRGFTALAAALEPAQVREMLREYYEVGTRIVLEHGGTLMQYVGDEIYALFGAPMPDEHHADKCVQAAIAFQEAAKDIAAHNAALGLPPLRYGIGINSGEVVAAHIGSSVRKQYSAIGDTINVGSRLCAIAPPGEINVSLYTKDRLTVDLPLEWRGPVALKGVDPDFKVYRVWSPDLPPLEESEAPAPKYAKPATPA